MADELKSRIKALWLRFHAWAVLPEEKKRKRKKKPEKPPPIKWIVISVGATAFRFLGITTDAFWGIVLGFVLLGLFVTTSWKWANQFRLKRIPKWIAVSGVALLYLSSWTIFWVTRYRITVSPAQITLSSGGDMHPVNIVKITNTRLQSVYNVTVVIVTKIQLKDLDILPEMSNDPLDTMRIGGEKDYYEIPRDVSAMWGFPDGGGMFRFTELKPGETKRIRISSKVNTKANAEVKVTKFDTEPIPVNFVGHTP